MRLLILAPLLVLLVLFALSNMEQVKLGLWPTDFVVELPLSIAMLGGMAVAFLAGGMLVWINELGQRRRARQAEHTVKLLEAQIAEFRASQRHITAPPPS
jgi:lipopolysaccharide assembly protein A